MAQGLAGLWQDMRLTSEPWTEFGLGSITAPTLIWQVSGLLVSWGLPWQKPFALQEAVDEVSAGGLSVTAPMLVWQVRG